MRASALANLRAPGIFPVALLEYAASQGVDVTALLHRCGLHSPLPVLREEGVLFYQLNAVFEGLAQLTQDPALGFRACNELPLTSYGPLGFAMISAENVEQAIELALKYWDLIGRVVQLHKTVNETHCEIRIELEVPFTGIVARWVLESAVAAMKRAHDSLVPQYAEMQEIWFDLPEPEHADEVRAALGNVRYNAAMTAVRFPKEWLALPLAMRSEAGRRHAEAQCNAQLLRLNQPVTCRFQVQRCLQLGANGYPTLSDVADKLGMSPRTLRRRLAQESVGFSDLLEEMRRRDAIQLLDNPTLSIGDISEKLGYEEAGNFARAFRSWTGCSPSEWRLQRRKEAAPK